MIRACLVAAFAAAATSVVAQPAPAPTTTTIKAIEATSAGQPIVMPQGPLRVTLSQTVIPARGGLPPHKHPYPRYVYVAAGRLKVTNLDTGKVDEFKAGDMTVDPIDQWHQAEVVGNEAVTLFVIDNAPPGAATSVRREP
jgi:quercetin dioxygenase-like cupin family protein